MRFKSIDDIVNDKNNNIDYETLRDLLNQRLKELYDEEKKTPLFDYADIQNSAKIDLIYELSDFAEKTGCKVELISLGSEEGDSLFSAFNGIAGILRYSIDI